MAKSEFILKLYNKLKNFPEIEVNDRISFYSEIIDDYIDEGLSETEAVSKLGSIDEIAETIAEDIPLSKLAKKKLNNRNKLSTLNIVLLIIGFPLWFSLLAVGFAVIILIGANENAFLPTIKSRCIILHFNRLSDLEIKSYLQEQQLLWR